MVRGGGGGVVSVRGSVCVSKRGLQYEHSPYFEMGMGRRGEKVRLVMDTSSRMMLK
jgi:hypothetical protein